MLKSEIIDRYGHSDFEWVMSTNINYVKDAEENVQDFGPYNGWQTFGQELPRVKDEDGNDTDKFAMIWVPYWGDREEGEGEGSPKDLFQRFYFSTLADGTTSKYGGYIKNLVTEPIYDNVEIVNKETGETIIEQVKIGEVLTSFEFDETNYMRYINLQPNNVPVVVENLIATANNETSSKIDAGTVPNSVQATVLNIVDIDGVSATEPVNYSYNEINREALQSAVLAVTNGATSAKITFDGMRPVKMPKEAVLRLWLEMETFVRQQQAYNVAYKAMVSAHKNDSKDKADYLESHYVYGMELEPEYQEIFNTEMQESMEELQAMAEYWGLNE